MCAHVHYVAVSGNTARNVALVSDWLATPGLRQQTQGTQYALVTRVAIS